jgi:general secretion pathway protein J
MHLWEGRKPRQAYRGFRPSHSHEKGFSLLEVLLALVLLALLLAGAWGGLRTATRAVHSGEALIERTNKLRVAQELLRRQLGQTLAMGYAQELGTGNRIVFEGGHDRITYVSPMPGYLGFGGPYVQRLSFERGERGGTQLVFRHRILNGYEDGDLDDASDVAPVVLLEGIARGQFEFRALDDEGKLDDWTDRWENEAMTPLLVRVKVEFERGSRMVWPELTIPLMIDPTAASSAFEPSFFTAPPGG